MRAHTWWMAVAVVAATGCGGAKSGLTAEADAPDASDSGDQEGDRRACGYGLPCDPTNLGRQTCETLGLRPGVLSCDPETCYLMLDECGPGGLTSAPTGSGAGVTQPLPPMNPTLFGGGQGATDGGLFAGGLFAGQPGGQQPNDGGVDEDGGTSSGGGNTPANGGFFGGGFFGGGFFGGGGSGGGFFGGGVFGGGGTGGGD
jgi:hypothetical protein